MITTRVRGPRTQRAIAPAGFHWTRAWLAIASLCWVAACDSPIEPQDPSHTVYTVGGAVSGLAGSGLVLVNDGGDNLAVSADGPITFASPLAKGAGYRVTVLVQPTNPTQTCVVRDGSGTVTTADVTTVAVACFMAGAASPFLVSNPVRSYSPTVVYVSLPSGAIPNGLSASLSDLHTGASFNATVVDGGFDPLALPAVAEDTVLIVVRETGGASSTSFLSVVAAGTAPIVVRTDPLPHTGDVSLNSLVVVVFSEPLDSATVNTGSVELRRGTTPLRGTVRFADDGHFRRIQSDSLVAYCWGVDGIGNPIGNSPSAVPVAGGLTFATVSAGYGHSCGVTTAGVAYCWGGGNDGELGDGTTNYRATPVPVAGGLTFAAVSAGGSHSCGVTTIGVAYCWGADRAGELGIGTSTGLQQCPPSYLVACSTVPVAVAGGLSFKTVIAADGHTCGVTTSAAPYCWGDNVPGVLGNGTNTGPEQCDEPDPWDFPGSFPCSSAPVAVAGGLNRASLTTGGYDYACGLTAAGAAHCWGTSPNGDLTPAPVAVASGFTFATLSTGETSTCGVTTAGVAYCWGSNDHGQLGDGSSRTNSSVPVKVYGQP